MFSDEDVFGFQIHFVFSTILNKSTQAICPDDTMAVSLRIRHESSMMDAVLSQTRFKSNILTQELSGDTLANIKHAFDVQKSPCDTWGYILFSSS